MMPPTPSADIQLARLLFYQRTGHGRKETGRLSVAELSANKPSKLECFRCATAGIHVEARK